MDMPKPGDAHKRLGAFVGTWSGNETLHPSPWDPAGGPAKARLTNRSILDGFGVVQEYEQARGGKVTFRGHGVFWYDDQKKEFVLTWWDSMSGRPGEYRGQFNGNVLRLDCPMPQGGHSRTSFDLSKPGRYGFSMEVSPDGQQWQPAMDGTYAKDAAPAAKTAAPAQPAPKARRSAKPVKRAAAKKSKPRKAGRKR